MSDIEVVPIEIAHFRFPDPELAGRQGVVMSYAVKHEGGVLVFDTGFGFGNVELDEVYRPVTRPILDALREVGITSADVTAVVNCHLHADHAGQNGALGGVPIHVQSAEWELAHTTDHTILEWIDAPEATYLLVDGDHEITPQIRLVATPGHTRGHQSLVLDTDQGPVVLAGQACYTVGEWDGDPDALEGRSAAPDPEAYDASIRRLRDVGPTRVHFGHDRVAWTAVPSGRTAPAILPGPC
jgi:N-acyl homoserine lactone hydrolase